jgi:hypothetical protein
MFIRISFKKYSKRNTFRIRSLLRLLIIVWLSKKYFNQLKVKLYKKNKYAKFHPLVKGPKCHKRGKEIFKYVYNRAFIVMKYYFEGELNTNQNYEYFLFMNKIFKNLTTSIYYQYRFDYTNIVNCSFL